MLKIITLFLIFPLFIFGEYEASSLDGEGHVINFEGIELKELVRYVSQISEVTFLFEDEALNVKVSMVSGKPMDKQAILEGLIEILQEHSLEIVQQRNYYLIRRKKDSSHPSFLSSPSAKESFFVYKLQYHTGPDILDALKQASSSLSTAEENLKKSLGSIQWVKSTNSLVYTANSIEKNHVESLIKRLDVPLKQVFIEVLVIETDVRKGLDFGVEWSLKGETHRAEATMRSPRLGNPLGFDLEIIGDLIRHNGLSFLSLSSLVSALQKESEVKIVLNQKVIAQDNKPSKIFVGDNIPFTGSTIINEGQHLTSNIDYRDIGVNLMITPLIGEGGMITLDISEEISEALSREQIDRAGIETTKTNMSTSVHVPDKHFLVLSGMARNSKVQKKRGIPCLGGLPWIGSLFSRNVTRDEKRSILIFVRPQIVETKHFTETPKMAFSS